MRLNSIVYEYPFSPPRFKDIIDQLHSSQIFFTLDLKNAFFMVKSEENSRKRAYLVTRSD